MGPPKRITLLSLLWCWCRWVSHMYGKRIGDRSGATWPSGAARGPSMKSRRRGPPFLSPRPIQGRLPLEKSQPSACMSSLHLGVKRIAMTALSRRTSPSLTPSLSPKVLCSPFGFLKWLKISLRYLRRARVNEDQPPYTRAHRQEWSVSGLLCRDCSSLSLGAE